jgi:hypothetical protein
MKTDKIVEHFLNTFAEEVSPNLNEGDVDILRKKCLKMCEAVRKDFAKEVLADVKKILDYECFCEKEGTCYFCRKYVELKRKWLEKEV